jgi:transcriptional regulator with XRE-family HTH domain
MKKPEKLSLFFEKVGYLCDRKSISASKMAEDLKFGNSTVTHWKNGRIPNGVRLIAIANYLGTTTDYLLNDAIPVRPGLDGGGSLMSEAVADEKPAPAAPAYTLDTHKHWVWLPIYQKIKDGAISAEQLMALPDVDENFLDRLCCGVIMSVNGYYNVIRRVGLSHRDFNGSETRLVVLRMHGHEKIMMAPEFLAILEECDSLRSEDETDNAGETNNRMGVGISGVLGNAMFSALERAVSLAEANRADNIKIIERLQAQVGRDRDDFNKERALFHEREMELMGLLSNGNGGKKSPGGGSDSGSSNNTNLVGAENK